MRTEAVLSGIRELFPPHRRCVLLGVGNELCRDDYAGMAVVRKLKEQGEFPGFLAVEGGSAPENVTGVITEFHPDAVIVVDAAFCGLNPGEYTVLSPDRITGKTFSTHMLPLPVMLSYLEAACGCVSAYIGMEPFCVEQGIGMDPAVADGVNKLAEEILAILREP